MINKLKNENILIKINILIIYFLFTVSVLFFGSDFFPFLSYIILITFFYTIYYSYKCDFRNIKKLFTSPFFVWFVIFWGLAVSISFFRNNIQLLGMIKSLIASSSIIFIFGALIFDKDTKESIDIFKVVQFCSCSSCIWMLINEYDLILSGERIGFSINIGNPNSIGTILALLTIFNLARFIEQKNIFNMAVFALSAIFVLLTGSKKSFLIVVLGFLLLLYKNNKISIKRVKFTLLLFAVIVISCLVVPILYEYIGRRFLELLGGLGFIDYQTDSSTTLRITYASKALDLWKQNIFLGGGFDNFRIHGGYGTYSHNNFTEILSSFGLIGLTIYYSIYLKFIKKLFVSHNRNSKLYLIILLTIFLTDIGSVTFLLYPIYYMLLILSNICINEGDSIDGKQTNN